MFGIRAKALFLYLTVIFVLNETGQTESAKLEFGCKFQNDTTYTLKTDDPIWSTKKDTPDRMVFDDFRKKVNWEYFTHSISLAFEEVYKNNTLNNVDQFMRFIQAYKNQKDNTTSLESFFKDYQVPFQPFQDPVSFLIGIYNQLKEKHSEVNITMYFVSAYVNPPEKIIEDIKYARAHPEYSGDNAEKKLTQDRSQRHVAGIIKIRKDIWEGVIVLDPGYINGNERVFPHSIVLMDKVKSGLNGEPVYGVSIPEIVDAYLGNKFALVSIRPTQCRGCEHKVLYLHYKPFCSFMDSTTKGNLLARNHGILKFGRYKAKPAGFLTFSVLKENPSFTIGPFELLSNTYLGQTSTFESIKSDVMNANSIMDFESATEKYLNLGEGESALSKLQAIQDLVLGDPDLVTAISELTRRLNPEPVVSSNQNPVVSSNQKPLVSLISQSKLGKRVGFLMSRMKTFTPSN